MVNDEGAIKIAEPFSASPPTAKKIRRLAVLFRKRHQTDACLSRWSMSIRAENMSCHAT